MSEREQLRSAIAALEVQRATLGDAIVDAALASMREKLAAIDRAGIADAAQAGERKQVTVMFADLSGFTALSETLDPEQVRSLVNGCFDALVPRVRKYGGVVDKFIGDEIMALFGAPATHENDAECALCAALEMVDALAGFNATHRVNLGMHFGIATGRVVAGGLGSAGQQQYSVMGEAVNLAARLEDFSESGQILVGPVTHRLTSPLFRFEPLPPVRLKGMAEPVAVYRLLGRRDTPEPTRGIAGLHSPLVGRDAEMQAILAVTYDLARGIGGALSVIGEAGLGKSRLVADASRATAESVRWVVGRAVPHAQGTSYALAGSLLDGLVGVAGESSRAVLSARLREFVLQHAPAKVDDVYPYLARMRDLPMDAEHEARTRELLPEALQGRIRAAFGELVRSCCQRSPLVLVGEDLHWCDPSSLDLLDSLVPLTAEVPLLVLPVFRPDEGAALGWHRRLEHTLGSAYRSLTLVPLDPAEGGKLIGNLLGTDALPVATRELILAKSEGNPFFVEELLRSLIDAGLVSPTGEGVAVDAVADLQVPDTVQSIVAARIDRLPSDAKRILQTASVIGRLFPKAILELVLRSEDAADALEAPLRELVARELVRAHGLAEYVFKHAITRDVAYESLLIARRRELHRRIAETMESVYADQLDELSPALAHHLVAGEAHAKALRYLTRAAERARETYANAEAIAFYRTAIGQAEALQRTAERPEIWREKAAELQESLGRLASMIGQCDDAVRAFAAARSLLPERDVVAQARLCRLDGVAFNVARRIPDMVAAYERAAKVLGEPQADAGEAWWKEWIDLAIERIWAAYVMARMPELGALVAEAHPVIDARGTPAQRARLFESMVLADLRRFRFFRLPDETLQSARRQLAAAQESGSRRAVGRALGLNGFVHLWRDELPEAERCFREGLHESERVGDVEPELIAMNYLALIGRMRGDIAMVRLWAERTVALAQRTGNRFYHAGALGSLGWAAMRDGADAYAKACLDEAIAVQGTLPTPLVFLFAGPHLALAVRRGDWASAIGHARALAHPMQRKLPDDIEAALQQAFEASDAGDLPRAGALLVRAVESLRQQATGYA